MELDKNIKLKIIIVDDSPDDHFFIKESMRSFKNIIWTSFYNGEAFWKYIEEAEKHESDLPDIAIMDINMPKLSGFEVFELMKEKQLQDNIVFYILTNNLTDTDLKKCTSLKIDCYKKPFSLEHFSELIQKLIKESKKIS